MKPQNVLNGKQLVELLASSVIDEEALDLFSIYIDDALYGGLYPITRVQIISELDHLGKSRRTVILKADENAPYEGR